MPFPSISPIALQIGPLAIHWYGIAYVIGILGTWQYCLWLLRRSPQSFPLLTRQIVDDYLGWAIAGIILGGRLGYVMFYVPSKYIANPLEIFQVWQGGMSFHGGLLGVTIATLVFSSRRKISPLALMDLACCGIPIGLFCGRIANFINGELYGRITDVSWGVVFPRGGPWPRHPSQLYEAGVEGLLLFGLLSFCAIKTNAPHRRGLLTGLFLVGYAAGRIGVECFRQPDAFLGYFVGGSTMGQWLSLPLLGLGIFLIAQAGAAKGGQNVR